MEHGTDEGAARESVYARPGALRRPRAVLGGIVAGGLVLGAAGAALAQSDEDERVRSYEARVREYSVRSESIDGARQDVDSPTSRTVIIDADVLFEFDSDELDSEAAGRLDDLADDLEELGSREVTVGGHTDSTGSPSYNQDLSERRAGSVRDVLEARLDDGFSFDVTGYGETEPVADNDTDEGQARNRRVEISFATD